MIAIKSSKGFFRFGFKIFNLALGEMMSIFSLIAIMRHKQLFACRYFLIMSFCEITVIIIARQFHGAIYE